MAIETVKMSSKGQIVIPQDIRQAIGADEGTVFAITSSDDALVLKKINIPSKEELLNNLKKIAVEAKAKLEKKGVNEAELRRK
jgi:AbrB family looped-hinge helix DNA binding protein